MGSGPASGGRIGITSRPPAGSGSHGSAAPRGASALIPNIRIHRDALARAFNIIKEQSDALDPIDGVQSEAGRYGNTLTGL